MVSQTSLAAYDKIKMTKADCNQARHIRAMLDNAPGKEFTRAELSEILSMRLSSVCARVREMLDKGMIDEGQNRQCSVTHSRVSTVKSKKAPHWEGQ